LSKKIPAFAGDSPDEQLLVTIGVAGPTSWLIDDTPVVTILVPVIPDIAYKGENVPHRTCLFSRRSRRCSKKKLTLIHTSTNILISDATARLSDEYPAVHAFDVFEFTVLGVIVLITGTIYRRMSNRSMP